MSLKCFHMVVILLFANEVNLSPRFSCTVEHYPFMVSLRWTENWTHFCAGTLVADSWVLTAAHCVLTTMRKEMSVFAGLSQMTRQFIQSSPVESVVLHPNYDPTTFANDIALLETEKKFTESDFVGFVKLAYASRFKSIFSNCMNSSTTVGWKTYMCTSESYNFTMAKLKCTELPLIANDRCKKFTNVSLDNAQICGLYYEGSANPCCMDSGGPLLCDDVQYGIVSSNRRCGWSEPAIFTRVDRFQRFISVPMARSSTALVAFSYFYVLSVLN